MQAKLDIKYIIPFVLAAIGTHDIAPDWCCWIMRGTMGMWLQAVYNFLSEYQLFSAILAIGIAFCGLWWAWHILKDKDFRWYRPAILLWGYIIINDHNTLQFVPLGDDLDYRNLFNFVGAFLTVTMVVKAIDRFFPFVEDVEQRVQHKIISRKHETNTDNGTGFPTDDFKVQHSPKALQQYAEVISEQLLGTSLKEHSFAVGITGEWGSGKTTFLDLLETKLAGKAEIVKFNPWMCRTPEQVTDDFFASLQHQLSPRHSSLSKPIRDYAKYITNATLSWGHGFLSKLTLAFPQESLQEKKKRLSERFLMLSKPVVVIIDDLDRLESSEVFEVLRLIRNTADLKNTIYVVAYDKEYVTRVLEAKNIMNSTAYLEKIFPVELHQPKVEDYQLLQVLYSDLKRLQLMSGKFADELYKRLNENDKQLIVKILGNYRQIRRFVRVYSLNVQYIQNVFANEIKLTDLFWMELLQIYDKSLYDTLAHEPYKLLYLKNGRYCLRPGILPNQYTLEEEKEYAYEDEPIWKDESVYILNKLFGKYIKVKAISISFRDNYDKFFTLGVSPYKLSRQEFQNLFKNQGKEEITVKGWLDEGKYFSSICHQMKLCDIKKINDDGLKTFIYGVLSYRLIMGEKGYDTMQSIKPMLLKEKYSSIQLKKGRTLIIDWIKEKIKQHRSPVVVTAILQGFYSPTEYDETQCPNHIEPFLITNADVESLLKDAMRDYLKCHSELTALSFFEEKSEAGRVFGNCCVKTDDSMIDDELDSWKQVVLDIITNYFKGYKKIPFEKQDEAYDKMFMDNMPEWSEDPYEQNFYQDAYENRNMRLNAYFGSNNELYKEFINTCFTNKEESKNEDKEKKAHEKETNKKKSKIKLLKKGKYRE